MKSNNIYIVIILFILLICIGVYYVYNMFDEGLDVGSGSSMLEERTKYTPYDIQEYHADPSTFANQDVNAYALNAQGQLVPLGSSSIGLMNDIRYYKPGQFKYGPHNYVPDYEDSVYLSRLSFANYANLPQNPLYTSTAPFRDIKQNGGFCKISANNKDNMERICNGLDKTVCASTECCTLLGGQKCVAGNESGPYMKSNYNPNVSPIATDFYFYKGTCYGNCK